MSAGSQEIATRAFAMEALAKDLASAVRHALAAKLDQSVVSELKHLQGVVEANREMAERSSDHQDEEPTARSGAVATMTGGKE